jgi:hypothetical protein
MTVKEAELLSTMSWIIGRIHIDRDALCFALQPVSVVIDHNIGKTSGHGKQVLGSDGIFESGQRRLGSEALSIDWISVEQKFLHRIVCQCICVITVWISGGNSVYALSEKIQIAVNNFSGLSRVAHAGFETFGQRKSVVYSFEQNGSSIGAAVWLIEGDRNGFEKIFAEKYRLCGKLSHREAFAFVFNLIAFKYLYEHKGFLFYIFMNNPG